MKHVVLDPEGRTVRYLRDGLEINLGSIGKGYALDRAAGLLRGEGGIRSGLLHGGYSSVYAIGSAPGDSRGWAIALRHPWQPDRQLGVVRLKDRGLGTSAATFKHLVHQGRKLGHLLRIEGAPAQRRRDEHRLVLVQLEAERAELPQVLTKIEAAVEFGEVLGVVIPATVPRHLRAGAHVKRHLGQPAVRTGSQDHRA